MSLILKAFSAIMMVAGSLFDLLAMAIVLGLIGRFSFSFVKWLSQVLSLSTSTELVLETVVVFVLLAVNIGLYFSISTEDRRKSFIKSIYRIDVKGSFDSLVQNSRPLQDVIQKPDIASIYNRINGIKKRLVPFFYLVGIAFFSFVSFASLSCLFLDLDWVHISSDYRASELLKEDCVGQLSDLYFWHFMDAIPGIRFPETIDWKLAYNKYDLPQRIILLIYRVAVILPIISAFKVWQTTKPQETTGTAS